MALLAEHTQRDFQQRRSHVLTTSISSFCFSSFSPPLSQFNILHPPPPPLSVPLLPSHLPVRSHSRNVARAGRARDEKMKLQAFSPVLFNPHLHDPRNIKQEYPTNPSPSLQATPLKPATVTLTFLFKKKCTKRTHRRTNVGPEPLEAAQSEQFTTWTFS